VQNIHWPATVDVLRAGEDSIEVVLLIKMAFGPYRRAFTEDPQFPS
jgi:hypothetical protein